MLKLTTSNIQLQQAADTKELAISRLAADLTSKGLVEASYIDGMLNREAQNSTFLGNGIAIPHGTTDTRHLVKRTGVAVHHFPNGVNWGDNNIIYVAIGIAAKSDEHLGILKQLTKVLSADGVEEKLKSASHKDDIIALLNGDVQFKADFNSMLILQHFPANDMIQLSAVAGGLIKNTGAANAEFVAELVVKEPTYLGNGLWLTSGNNNVSRTVMSFISAAEPFQFNNQPVKALIAFSVCNSSHQNQLATLSQLVFQQKQATITQANSQELLALFNSDEAADNSDTADSSNSSVFTISNAHGLHARPGAMLVAEAKKFESTIKVINLTGGSKAINAKSLMKVMAIGAQKGHELKFIAEGIDADEALKSIGLAIEAGLGEG